MKKDDDFWVNKFFGIGDRGANWSDEIQWAASVAMPEMGDEYARAARNAIAKAAAEFTDELFASSFTNGTFPPTEAMEPTTLSVEAMQEAVDLVKKNYVPPIIDLTISDLCIDLRDGEPCVYIIDETGLTSIVKLIYASLLDLLPDWPGRKQGIRIFTHPDIREAVEVIIRENYNHPLHPPIRINEIEVKR